MNVVTALNEKYVPYTYVMLFSLFEKNSEKSCVYLLQDDLSEKSKEELRKLCDKYGNEVCFIQMDRNIFDERLLATHDWSMETCFRLAMNDVLPGDLDRLIYLDGDMIINKDISDLYHMEFAEGKHLIATHDMTMTPDSGAVYGDLHTEVFNRLIRDNKYFNAGMILMDYSYLRDHYHFSDYMEMAKGLDFKIFAPDQDLLNLMHEDQVEYVDSWKYDLFACNAFIRDYGYEKVKEEVSIIHFVGEKPWFGGNHFHYDVEVLWWDYANQTIYASDLQDDFLDTYAGPSEFYDAVQKGEEFNRNLRKDLVKTLEACQKLIAIITGKDEEKVDIGEARETLLIPPIRPVVDDDSCKKDLIFQIITDNRIKEYVDYLRGENESLKKQLDEAVNVYYKLKNGLG